MLNKSVFVKCLWLAIALTVIFLPLETKAAWGDFDPTFGSNGTVIDPVTGYIPKSLAIQPDGKILVTGYRILITGGRGRGFFLRRYLSNGQLDASFGKNGAATFTDPTLINSDYEGEKILVQANGKIAVAGRADDFYAVWQFTSSGKGDTAFGQNGLQILTSYQRDHRAPDLNIQSGKLLLTFPKIGAGGEPIMLIRLNSNGAIDQTFGNFGESLTNLQGIINGSDCNFGTVVESDGKITIGGKTAEDYVSKELVRKLSDGSPDPTFFPTPSSIYVGMMAPSGLIKLSNSKYLIISLNLGGPGASTGLDLFSAKGFYETSSSLFDIGSCPAILTNQSDGKILIQLTGPLFRIDADLGSQEWINCQNLQGVQWQRGAIQTDDKIVVAGVYNDNLFLARLLPN